MRRKNFSNILHNNLKQYALLQAWDSPGNSCFNIQPNATFLLTNGSFSVKIFHSLFMLPSCSILRSSTILHSNRPNEETISLLLLLMTKHILNNSPHIILMHPHGQKKLNMDPCSDHKNWKIVISQIMLSHCTYCTF